jgi:hypothetical protein
MKPLLFFQLLFFTISTELYSQKEIDAIEFIDSTWNFTHSDTTYERNGLLINYYDSLSVSNDSFEKYFVGQNDLDSLMKPLRKLRVLATGMSYSIQYYNGKPISGGYGNGTSKGSRTASLQWHENGNLKYIVNFLILDDLVGVKDGISLLCDENGSIIRFELFSNDQLVFRNIKKSTPNSK